VPRPDRRLFLASASTAGAFVAAHGCWAAGELQRAKDGQDDPLIRRLELVSSAPLADMKEFYHKSLGLDVVEDKPDRLSIDAGRTRLTFLKPAEGKDKPFYHFAFNIPENKAAAAREWQVKRTPLLPIPQALRDPAYPDDVVHYRHWNAHSVFFFDPAGNVVEYIARHDLKNAAAGGFGSADILYASEIAFVVDDVPAATTKLKEALGLGEYNGTGEQFAALGDERGLLLVMKRGRVISFEAKEKKEVGVFPTVAGLRGARPSKYALPEFPYNISVGQ
jgi:catechol-2,3-dioxygenase